MGEAAGERPKAQILIVDDSEDMRLLLGQILEEEEYLLSFADNGPSALEQAQAEQPDLILMDMSLPGMSGWEVVSRLRQSNAFAQTPIIAVTAHVAKADQDRAMEIGCNAHLGKPFDVTAVLMIIEQFLKK